MKLELWKKVLILALALPLTAATVGSPLMLGQEKTAETNDAKPAKARKGRLPAYYADIVTEEQRTKIYEIQAKYSKELESLSEQIAAVTKKQREEMEAVLSPEQKDKLKKSEDDAVAKRKKKAADSPKKKAGAPSGDTAADSKSKSK